MLHSCLAIITSQIIVAAAGAQITIPVVPVGDPGNAPDTRVSVFDGTSGYGRVDYVFSIGKYEVTTREYVAFLNAVASTDTYGLFNPNQTVSSGVIQSGTSGNYSYSVMPAFINRPMANFGYWHACRFANWLHNGQPVGPQNDATTEDGSYTITPQGIQTNSINRNAGARWAIPTENEWYKAAYFKLGTVGGGYHLYPTRSSTPPGTDLQDLSGNNANYYYVGEAFIGSTPVGQFQNTFSPCGAFDMGGNLLEFCETFSSIGPRVLRGGMFWSGVWDLRADYITSVWNPANAESWGSGSVGLRLVQLFASGCDGDVNNDGFVDDSDFVIFAMSYNILDCEDAAMPPGCPSDISNDGYVDDADFVLFVAAYNALLCP